MILALVFLAISQASPAPQLAFERLGLHEEAVHDLFYADGGKALVTSTRGGVVRIWDVRSGKLAGEYRHEDALDQIVPSQDGKQVVFVSKSTFGVLDAKDADFGGSMAHPPTVLHCVVFVPKWRWLFAGQDEGILRRFSSGNLAEAGDTLGTQLGTIVALASAPSGKLLAAGDSAGAILLVDPVKLDALAQLSGHTSAISALVFDVDARTLFSASLDRSVRSWDVEARGERVLLEDNASPVLSLALDAKGARLAAGDESGVVLVLETRSGKLLRRIETGAGPITAVAFDPKGKVLATPGPEKTVALWDVRDVH